MQTQRDYVKVIQAQDITRNPGGVRWQQYPMCHPTVWPKMKEYVHMIQYFNL